MRRSVIIVGIFASSTSLNLALTHSSSAQTFVQDRDMDLEDVLLICRGGKSYIGEATRGQIKFDDGTVVIDGKEIFFTPEGGEFTRTIEYSAEQYEDCVEKFGRIAGIFSGAGGDQASSGANYCVANACYELIGCTRNGESVECKYEITVGGSEKSAYAEWGPKVGTLITNDGLQYYLAEYHIAGIYKGSSYPGGGVNVSTAKPIPITMVFNGIPRGVALSAFNVNDVFGNPRITFELQ